MIQSAKRRRKDFCDDDRNNGSDYQFVNSYSSSEIAIDEPIVDLSSLQMNTLRRYKKHYRVPTKPGINKSQLADVLSDHFQNIDIDEKEAIAFFIYMVKCNRNKLDQNKPILSSLPNSNLDQF